MKTKFLISGMSCAACAVRVEKAAAAVAGVEQASVNLLQNSLTVQSGAEIPDTAVITAIQVAGYRAQPWPAAIANSSTRQVAQEEKNLLLRLKYSVVLLLVLLYLSMGQMLGVSLPSYLIAYVGWGQLILAGAILWINRVLFQSGFVSLWHRSPTMNSLIALGSSTAFLYSLFLLVCLGGHHELYFESAAMIVTLIGLGKYLETRAKRNTTGALEELVKLSPQKALRVENGQTYEIEAQAIGVGDILAVPAGLAVAADGVIIQGYGVLNEAALTGESIPVDRTAGQLVRAGTVNTDGYFEMKVLRVGADTVLSQVIQLVEEASATKAPIGRLADRVSGFFVPVVIGLACLTALSWWIAGVEIGFGLRCAVAVLVISCPCALGLATPTAIMVGTGVAARRGILFKSAESLENAHHVQVVLFDKTGTLTRGIPEVTEVLLAENTPETLFWKWVVSAEKCSSHPLAKAIVRSTAAKQVQPDPVESFQLLPGKGIQAQLQGKTVLIGNRELIAQSQIALPESIHVQAEKLAEEGKTVLYVAADGKYHGLIALADGLKPGVREAVAALQKMGKETVLLSGDHLRTARAIARQVGIEQVIAGVLPHDKEAQVRRLQEQGKQVAMVGDGVNDAPALARAEVGIAMGTGTDVALETADIVLMQDKLSSVAEALQLSQAVIWNIKENLFWAFFYNVLGIPLAAGVFYPWLGWQLSPMFAAVAMSISSVSVVGNALRLRRFSPSLSTVIQEKSMITKTIQIEGMMCAHCAGRVEEALNRLPGVSVKVNLAKKQATVTGTVSEDSLKTAVEQAGYHVLSIH